MGVVGLRGASLKEEERLETKEVESMALTFIGNLIGGFKDKLAEFEENLEAAAISDPDETAEEWMTLAVDVHQAGMEPDDVREILRQATGYEFGEWRYGPGYEYEGTPIPGVEEDDGDG